MSILNYILVPPKKHHNFTFQFSRRNFLLGLLLVVFGFIRINEKERIENPTEIHATLNREFILVKGRKSPVDYKFWSHNYKCQFNILDCSSTNEKLSEFLKAAKDGDSLLLTINSTDLKSLQNEYSNVSLLGLKINNEQLFDLEDFKISRSKYKNRVSNLPFFAAALFLFVGLVHLESKYKYGLFGITFLLVLFMRIFRIILY